MTLAIFLFRVLPMVFYIYTYCFLFNLYENVILSKIKKQVSLIFNTINILGNCTLSPATICKGLKFRFNALFFNNKIERFIVKVGWLIVKVGAKAKNIKKPPDVLSGGFSYTG